MMKEPRKKAKQEKTVSDKKLPAIREVSDSLKVLSVFKDAKVMKSEEYALNLRRMLRITKRIVRSFS